MFEPQGQLPLLPFIHNSNDIFFFLLVLARVSGLFFVSPFLSHQAIRNPLKAFFTVITTALIASTLWAEYRGPHATRSISIFSENSSIAPGLVLLLLVKELAIGYIIGFCFHLMIEALQIAGQVVSVVIGFSMAEILDPVSGMNQSIVSNLFVITATLFILVLDIHHIFFIATTHSFTAIPIGESFMPYELMEDVLRGSARAFLYALHFAAVPYVILILITIGLGLMAKVMPEMNIFMIGFPLKIFIGYFALIVSIGYFPTVLQEGFIEFTNLIEIIILRIGGHK